MSSLGVDVSVFQGFPDWRKVFAAGYRFAYVKSAQYPHYVNPDALKQRHDAHQAGLYVGNYCYAVARYGDAIGQANLFLNRTEVAPWHLLPALDLEESGSEGVSAANLESFVMAWGTHTAAMLGVRNLVLYTDLNMLRNRILVTRRLRSLYVLWLADWTKGPAPTVPGWRVVMHQFDPFHSIPGFSGPVDRDRSLVPLSTLQVENAKTRQAKGAKRLPRKRALSLRRPKALRSA